MRPISFVMGVAVGTIFWSVVASAWTGPSQAAPNGNVNAPINVGSTAQIKNGSLGVNSLAVYGNTILSGTGLYLNFGNTAGAGGYGIRDNGGTLEFKSTGGLWTNLNTTFSTYLTLNGDSAVYLPKYVAWGALGTGDGGAAIYNDNGTYKKLMIVGNNSAGGSREVGIWDNLTINGQLKFPDGTIQRTAAGGGRTLTPICVGVNYSGYGSKAYLFPNQTSCDGSGWTTAFVFYAYM